jgi:hypothetical protein
MPTPSRLGRPHLFDRLRDLRACRRGSPAGQQSRVDWISPVVPLLGQSYAPAAG